MFIHKRNLGQVRFAESVTTSHFTQTNKYCIDKVRIAETTITSQLAENNDYFKNDIIPTCNDVLKGRGKSTNFWKGNEYYRDLIQCYKLEYVVATPDEQKNIARHVISTIRGLIPAGRFLELDKGSGSWCDIGDENALSKVRQSLREGAPELREQLTPNAFGAQIQDETTDYEFKQFVKLIFEGDGMD